MCELFGVNSAEKAEVNELLREFFSHSDKHPNGWGMAFFYENSVSLEKEPVQALRSTYLKERLRHPVQARCMFAHIRRATVGTIEYENCHPFVRRDSSGRSWTLIHNGTIFDYPALHPYIHQQEGRTDSERILYYIVDQIDKKCRELGHPLEPQERFVLLEELICNMSKGNKLNLLIFDGEYMYAHTNYADSLYVNQSGDQAVFATTPLGKGSWKPLPFAVLCVYQEGKQIYRGAKTGTEYKDNETDQKYLFMDFAHL